MHRLTLLIAIAGLLARPHAAVAQDVVRNSCGSPSICLNTDGAGVIDLMVGSVKLLEVRPDLSINLMNGASFNSASVPGVFATIKADYGTGTPLTYTDPSSGPYSKRAAAWFRSVGTAAGQGLIAVGTYAAPWAGTGSNGSSIIAALNVAEVPATTTGNVSGIAAARNELDIAAGGGTITRGDAGVSWAFQLSGRPITTLTGQAAQVFAQGAGVITSLVGADTLVERDPGAATNSVTNAFGSRITIMDSIGDGWGTGTGYGSYVSQSGGGFTTVYGQYIDALTGTTKYAFYGVDPIHSSATIEGARFATTSATGTTVANVGSNSCGTTAATVAGNETSGVITVGATSGTQCRVAFATAATTARDCVVTDSTTTGATRATYVDTTHTDFLGSFTAGDKVTYICIAR